MNNVGGLGEILYFCFMNYKIFPPDGILEAEIGMPLSKSVSNRQLIISALAGGSIEIDELAECSDTAVMQHALSTTDSEIDCRDAGTAMRFLTAYFACQPGRNVTLKGTDRMHERPIGPLVDALRSCGADITYLERDGFPPLKIVGSHLTSSNLNVDSSISSQFISALLMIAPTMTGGMKLRLEGEPVSLPYIDLTLSLMQKAGISCERAGGDIEVSEGSYSPTRFSGDGDWSAAAFWLEIEALSGGFITLTRISESSRQPDCKALEFFSQLGAVIDPEPEEERDDAIQLIGSPDVAPRFSAFLAATPDLAPAIAVTCAMIGVPFRLTGLEGLAIKESDRLSALATELTRIGVVCSTDTPGTLEWDGRRMPVVEVPRFSSYGDHRMAMSLAPVAIFIPGIVIEDAEVVGKSYPDFWDDLREAGFHIVDADQEDESETESEE